MHAVYKISGSRQSGPSDRHPASPVSLLATAARTRHVRGYAQHVELDSGGVSTVPLGVRRMCKLQRRRHGITSQRVLVIPVPLEPVRREHKVKRRIRPRARQLIQNGEVFLRPRDLREPLRQSPLSPRSASVPAVRYGYCAHLTCRK